MTHSFLDPEDPPDPQGSLLFEEAVDNFEFGWPYGPNSWIFRALARGLMKPIPDKDFRISWQS